MSLHLIQDLCTRKGITPLFPFSEMEVSGSIRPCDRYDPRIFRFHVQHFIAACLIYFTGLPPGKPAFFLPALGSVCAALCLIVMVRQSCVEIDRQTVRLSLMKTRAAATFQAYIPPGEK